MCCSAEKFVGYDVRKSQSVFSTQIGSPSAGETTDRSGNLMEIFTTWKNYCVNRQRAWEYLYPEINERDRKINVLRKRVLQGRERYRIIKVFMAWRNAGRGREREGGRVRTVFVRKMIRGWRKVVEKRKRLYACSWKVQEKGVGGIERQYFREWKAKFGRVRKLKNVFRHLKTKLLKNSLDRIANYSNQRCFCYKLSFQKLQALISSRMKLVKSKIFHRWSVSITREACKSLKLEYESTIHKLMKQILTQSQDLARERQVNSERELQMKSLLTEHAQQLYSNLCGKY